MAENKSQNKANIIEMIKREGRILDINLAQYFNQHPWLFHDKIKKSTRSSNYRFCGIVKGANEYVELDYGANIYCNIGLTLIEPETEACMLTKEDICSDLAEIFPQLKDEVEELIKHIND